MVTYMTMHNEQISYMWLTVNSISQSGSIILQINSLHPLARL